jgi:type I restriction enzyme, S subunit
MEELPQSWCSVPLAEIVNINPGIDKSQFRDDEEVPFVPMPAVEAETGRMDTSERRQFGKVKSGFTPFATGDVLFAKITPCMENGKMAVVPTLPRGVGFGTTEFHVLRPTDAVDAKLVYYFVSSSSIRHEAQHQMTGAVGQKRVPKRYLETKPFPLPPLNEQRRIVEKVETLFARLDQGEEAIRTVQTLIARYRQSVLKAAVTGELTAGWRAENAHRLEHGRDLLARILKTRRETWDGRGKYKEPAAPDTTGLPDLPEGWVWASVDQLTRIVTKGSSPKWQGFEYVPDGVLFVRSQNVGWGDLRLDDRAFLPEAFNLKESKSIIRSGDLLLNIVGASIGRAAVATGELEGANCNQAVAIIRLIERPMAYFLLRYLLGPSAQSIIHSEKVDVARANYSLEQIRMLSVPVPPMGECEEIARQVDYAESQILTLQSWCQTELARSAALRQSILRDAFEGRLVPQDPADEPASALLARIKAERAAAPGKSRRKARS